MVITSGLPRKPGMTREELIGMNAGIVKGVAEKTSLNTLQMPSYHRGKQPDGYHDAAGITVYRITQKQNYRKGGALDSARFKYQLSQQLAAVLLI